MEDKGQSKKSEQTSCGGHVTTIAVTMTQTFLIDIMSSFSTFPFARFGSLLGVHTTLLAFVALYLPRSSFVRTPLPPQASSKDRPQHPFLRPLTADPLLTLGWLCVGVAFVQVSWAGWLKSETDNARPEVIGEDEETRIKRKMKISSERFKVGFGASTRTSVFIRITTERKRHMRCDTSLLIWRPCCTCALRCASRRVSAPHYSLQYQLTLD